MCSTIPLIPTTRRDSTNTAHPNKPAPDWTARKPATPLAIVRLARFHSRVDQVRCYDVMLCYFA